MAGTAKSWHSPTEIDLSIPTRDASPPGGLTAGSRVEQSLPATTDRQPVGQFGHWPDARYQAAMRRSAVIARQVGIYVRFVVRATAGPDPHRSDDVFIIINRFQILYLPLALVVSKSATSRSDRILQHHSYPCNRLIAGLHGCFGLRDIDANHQWLLRWRPDYCDDRA